MRLGNDRFGNSVFVPFSSLLPMVHPNDLVVGGWDISSLSIGASSGDDYKHVRCAPAC